MAEKLGIKELWTRKSPWLKALDIVILLFALAGFAILGAWGAYQLGVTNNKGGVDKNYRYLMSVEEMEALQDSTLTEQQIEEQWFTQYAKLAAYGRFYPTLAHRVDGQLLHYLLHPISRPLYSFCKFKLPYYSIKCADAQCDAVSQSCSFKAIHRQTGINRFAVCQWVFILIVMQTQEYMPYTG